MLYQLDKAFFQELEDYEPEKKETDDIATIHELIYSTPEELSMKPLDFFENIFKNIDDYAELVHFNNEYLSKMESKLEAAKGVRKKRRVL